MLMAQEKLEELSELVELLIALFSGLAPEVSDPNRSAYLKAIAALTALQRKVVAA